MIPQRDPLLERLCGIRADKFVGKRSLSPAHLYLLGRIWLALLVVPTVRLRLEAVESGSEAHFFHRWLGRTNFGLRTLLHKAGSVLHLERRADALEGSRFATVRRMERKAAKLGVTCREVRPDERERLLQKAVEFEQSHPDVRYRRERPNVDGLRSVGLWVVAVSVEGEPLALAITPVSGNAALLRYMRTLGFGKQSTVGRYALMAELLRILARRRVRYLVDNVSPLSLQSSLRHFATMTGFRIVRVDLVG